MEEKRNNHPLMMGAAVSVIILSMVGVGAIMGWLPTSKSTPENSSATAKGAPNDISQNATAAACQACGVIDSIKIVSVQDKPSGVGAIVGGVAGAIVGHQVGGGTGKDLATIGGAAGGAYLGNEVEKGTKRHETFRVTVRMDDGTRRVIHTNKQNFVYGQKVKIINDEIVSI